MANYGNTCDEVCEFLKERYDTQDFLVLDTETEGIKKGVIDLAIIGPDGSVLFDSLIHNEEPIMPRALAIHHISEAMLVDAPSFKDTWPKVHTILKTARYIITYNAAFDLARIEYSTERSGITWNIDAAGEPQFLCLMRDYAEHWGEIYWAGYRPQKLEIALFQQKIEHQGFHRALSDAQAAYKLMRCLATKADRQTEPLIEEAV